MKHFKIDRSWDVLIGHKLHQIQFKAKVGKVQEMQYHKLSKTRNSFHSAQAINLQLGKISKQITTHFPLDTQIMDWFDILQQQEK